MDTYELEENLEYDEDFDGTMLEDLPEHDNLLKTYCIPVHRGSTLGVCFPHRPMNHWGWVNLETLAQVAGMSSSELMLTYGALSRNFQHISYVVPMPFVSRTGKFVPANELDLQSVAKYIPAGWALLVLEALEKDVVRLEVFEDSHELTPNLELRWNFIADGVDRFSVFAISSDGEIVAP